MKTLRILTVASLAVLFFACATKTECEQFVDDYEQHADGYINMQKELQENPNDVAKITEKYASLVSGDRSKFSNGEIENHMKTCDEKSKNRLVEIQSKLTSSLMPK